MKKPSSRVAFGLCKRLIVAFIFVAPVVATAASDNLLKDPGFEQNLSADQGGWITWDESEISSKQARSGSQSMFNWGFSRTVLTPPYLLGTASGSFQELAAQPGSRWRMIGYAMAPDGIRGNAFGIVQVSFFDDEGNDLGTVETKKIKGPLAKTSNQVNRKTPAGNWVLLDTGVATAPENATKIHAFTLFVDYSGSEVAQGVYFDDITLCSLDPGDDAAGCK